MASVASKMCPAYIYLLLVVVSYSGTISNSALRILDLRSQRSSRLDEYRKLVSIDSHDNTSSSLSYFKRLVSTATRLQCRVALRTD